MTIRRKRLGRWLVAPLLSVASLAANHSDLRLVDAVEKQDKASVRSLLSEKIDVNVRQPDGATALAWAARWDDLEIAHLLIDAGANVNAANDYGVTPLWLACGNGSAAMVDVLLRSGADPNAALLSGETALMAATEAGSLEAVKLLLAQKANPHATESSGGQNALMWAVAEGHPDIVRALVEHGADINARSKGGFTPLLFAAQQGDVESARILVAAGGNVNEGAPPRTPSALLIASASGHADFSTFLLDQGADPNQADGKGFTSLHYAAMRRNMLEAVKALLAHGANPNARLPKDAPEQGGVTEMSISGATPLFLAAAAGNGNIVRALAAGGADPLVPTADNTTALMVAAGVGLFENRNEDAVKAAFETVRLLVEMGSDINAVGEHGWTALHGAAYTGADDTLQFLVEKGAKMDVMDEFGQTPLSIAQAVVTPGVINDAYKRARAYRKTTSDLLVKLGAPSLAASRVQIIQALPEDYSSVTAPEQQQD